MANRNVEFAGLWTAEGVVCLDAEETLRLGAWLANEVSIGSVVSLEGHLGAGKTQLSKGLVAALGYEGEVTSPSYALVHEYRGKELLVSHFDFYRMKDVGELETTGYDDCLAVGVTLIEWGNKFLEVLPPGTIRLQIELLPESETGRRMRAERV